MTPTIWWTLAAGAVVLLALVAYQFWYSETHKPPTYWKLIGPAPVRTWAVLDTLIAMFPRVGPATIEWVTEPWAYGYEGGKAMGQTDTKRRYIKLLTVPDVFQTAIFHEWRTLMLGVDEENPVADAVLRDAVRAKLGG